MAQFPEEIYVQATFPAPGKPKSKIQLEAYTTWEDGTEDGDEFAVYKLVKVCRVKVIQEKRLEEL